MTMTSKLVAATGLFWLACTSVGAQVANTPEIAAKLPELGSELSREMVGGTMGLYKPLHAADTGAGVTVLADQTYGEHDRNRLDLYLPEGATGPVPVVVFVHGGGFVRGDKGDVSNIGRYLARAGYAAALINYRFAPDNQWPSGAQDLAAALGWLQDNASANGLDAGRIVIAGNSAGSMHVADYTFREELQNVEDGVVGAILISPPTVDLTAREVDPARDALYYGTDGDRSAQSVVTAVDGRKIPVLVGYAQNEPAVISDQTRLLIEALNTRDSRLPLIASAPGHNHISIVEHIGTADETLGPQLLTFISGVTQ
ncbi:alpha/beta hydrolase [Pseudoprimorskyibacter insulae]|uniref:Carboxylesterase NlhH n=1 Tax=Pseudoprimorskyibacter insulae TaxID=1695997 RepID=A0A2R8AQV5_9RHOB|nr:alpha/beta hydrolase [Pseudoprimorskyibacter insulae]SPF78478.1 Carboxylesterase NlhH [Pseudoprimorskyibacter insulae]